MNTNLIRADGRRWDELRPISITTGYQASAEGSALIEMGQTVVLCAASVDEQVPGWMRGRGSGWVTAEYDMLPRATSSRRSRDRDTGRTASRSQEIQRLIGRSCALPPICRLWASARCIWTATFCKPTAAPGRRP